MKIIIRNDMVYKDVDKMMVERGQLTKNLKDAILDFYDITRIVPLE